MNPFNTLTQTHRHIHAHSRPRQSTHVSHGRQPASDVTGGIRLSPGQHTVFAVHRDWSALRRRVPAGLPALSTPDEHGERHGSTHGSSGRHATAGTASTLFAKRGPPGPAPGLEGGTRAFLTSLRQGVEQTLGAGRRDTRPEGSRLTQHTPTETEGPRQAAMACSALLASVVSAAGAAVAPAGLCHRAGLQVSSATSGTG